ncbi:MAG: hypothetical protein ACFHU9_01580 [Fluviicola sp.]
MNDKEFERNVETAARLLRIEEKLQKAQKSSKPAWLSFFESTSGAALITVLIGGVFGTMITTSIQSNQQDRQRKMELYTVTLNEHDKKVAETSELIGNIVMATTSYFLTYGPRFQKDYNLPDSADYNVKIKRQVEKIRADYNTVQAEWEKKKIGQGSLLVYYSGNNDKVKCKWRQLTAKIKDYMNFAESFTKKEYFSKIKETNIYREEIDVLINQLMDLLSNGRKDMWEKLNS